ncbi:MAG: hypothetical protein ACI4RD_02525 [Kiritimatiellia bacterium]
MNRNAVIGLMLVVSAGALAGVCVAANGGVAESLFGKAIWYLPYVALVVGVRQLARARG